MLLLNPHVCGGDRIWSALYCSLTPPLQHCKLHWEPGLRSDQIKIRPGRTRSSLLGFILDLSACWCFSSFATFNNQYTALNIILGVFELNIVFMTVYRTPAGPAWSHDLNKSVFFIFMEEIFSKMLFVAFFLIGGGKNICIHEDRAQLAAWEETASMVLHRQGVRTILM